MKSECLTFNTTNSRELVHVKPQLEEVLDCTNVVERGGQPSERLVVAAHGE